MKEVIIFIVGAALIVALLFASAYFAGLELKAGHPFHKIIEWLP